MLLSNDVETDWMIKAIKEESTLFRPYTYAIYALMFHNYKPISVQNKKDYQTIVLDSNWKSFKEND